MSSLFGSVKVKRARGCFTSCDCKSIKSGQTRASGSPFDNPPASNNSHGAVLFSCVTHRTPTVVANALLTSSGPHRTLLDIFGIQPSFDALNHVREPRSKQLANLF